MRRGQVGGGAAANLVLIIGAFVLIYLLFLPAEDRNELLDKDSKDGITKVNVDEFERFLLDEHPGTLLAQKERSFTHNIPSFTLRTDTEDEVIRSIDSIYLDKTEPLKSIPLFLEDRPDNALLSFNVKDHSGILTISLNDEEVYKGEAENVISPISIALKESNILEFSVNSPPGWQFWKSNFYDIKSIQIVGTVEKKERQESISTFFAAREEAEAENVEQAYIVYLADCQTTTVGPLSVYLNDELLSSRIPDCGELDKTFIDPSTLAEGRNELRFFAEDGSYLIDRIFVKTFLTEPIFPVYFFDVNESQFKNMENGKINATVNLKLVNDDERKKATLRLNDHKISLDTRDNAFSKKINAFLEEGSNSLQIEPERTLHVLDMNIELTCRKREDCK